MMSPAAFLAPSPSSLSLRLNPESAPGIREDLMFLRPYAVRTSPPKPSWEGGLHAQTATSPTMLRYGPLPSWPAHSISLRFRSTRAHAAQARVLASAYTITLIFHLYWRTHKPGSPLLLCPPVRWCRQARAYPTIPLNCS